MAKVGRFVTDPRAGAYCQVTLDKGEKILVSHNRSGFAGGSVTIQEVRWGLASGAILFRCDLEHDDSRPGLAQLTRGIPRRERSLSDVRAKCTALVSPGPQSTA
jgi:hypothetical protein